MDFRFLSDSIGKVVQLERGGPDKLVGELVDVRCDYLVLRTKEHGIQYCASWHIKTITEPIVSRIDSQCDSDDEDRDAMAIPILEAENFRELLEKMESNLVQINHSGPNMLKGVLYSADRDYDWITLIHDMKEYVYFPIFHIRSISQIYEMGQEKKHEKGDRDSEKHSDKHGEEGRDKKKSHGGK